MCVSLVNVNFRVREGRTRTSSLAKQGTEKPWRLPTHNADNVHYDITHLEAGENLLLRHATDASMVRDESSRSLALPGGQPPVVDNLRVRRAHCGRARDQQELHRARLRRAGEPRGLRLRHRGFAHARALAASGVLNGGFHLLARVGQAHLRPPTRCQAGGGSPVGASPPHQRGAPRTRR